MSTFLQLCKDYCRECDIGAGEDAITTVVSQDGELNRVVGDVKNAWIEIQRMKAWKFMRGTFTVSTVSGTGAYAYTDCTDSVTAAAISLFNRWRFDNYRDPPKIYLSASGVGAERWLTWVEWDDFKNLYKIGTQNNAAPQHITANPFTFKFELGPKPNAVFVVTGDYQKSVQIMTLDATEPICNSDYHPLILYRAMKKYANRENAPEIYNQAIENEGLLWADLLRTQLPKMGLAGPMA